MSNETLDLYHNMRLEFIRLCPDCKAPTNDLDAGSYCQLHKRFEKLDDAMIDAWLKQH